LADWRRPSERWVGVVSVSSRGTRLIATEREALGGGRRALREIIVN